MIRLTAFFSMATMEAKIHGSNVLKESNCNLRTPYPAKISSKNKGENKAI